MVGKTKRAMGMKKRKMCLGRCMLMMRSSMKVNQPNQHCCWCYTWLLPSLHLVMVMMPLPDTSLHLWKLLPRSKAPAALVLEQRLWLVRSLSGVVGQARLSFKADLIHRIIINKELRTWVWGLGAEGWLNYCKRNLAWTLTERLPLK